MHTTFGYFDLIETFPRAGCAVCNLLQRDVTHLLDSILYEYSVDRSMQAGFRASRGLCNQHGWQFTKLGNALSAAVLYEAALDEVLTVMEASGPDERARQGGLFGGLFGRGQSSALAEALMPKKPCAACAAQDAAESRYVTVIGEQIQDERIQSAYRDSDGLCLPHFRQTLRHAQDAESSRLLVALQKDIWSRLRAELNEFMRKSDYQNAGEKIGAEGTSWQRVVARLAGEHGVFGLRRTGR